VDEVLQLFELAWDGDPGNEELGNQAFMAAARANSFLKQQQMAARLNKTFPKDKYLYWTMLSMLLQAQEASATAGPDAKEPLPLVLASRMIVKAKEDGKITDIERTMSKHVYRGKHHTHVWPAEEGLRTRRLQICSYTWRSCGRSATWPASRTCWQASSPRSSSRCAADARVASCASPWQRLTRSTVSIPLVPDQVDTDRQRELLRVKKELGRWGDVRRIAEGLLEGNGYCPSRTGSACEQQLTAAGIHICFCTLQGRRLGGAVGVSGRVHAHE